MIMRRRRQIKEKHRQYSNTASCCSSTIMYNTAALAACRSLPPRFASRSFSAYLAHMNYARLRAPLDDPRMAEFMAAVDPINALARATPGYVWSLDDTADEERREVPVLHEDPLLMPQLSLWESHESLQHFAFKSGHAMYYKRKKEWFTAPVAPWAVCWWFTPSDERPVPTLGIAFDRLEVLRVNGPTANAFDLKTAKDFPKPAVDCEEG